MKILTLLTIMALAFLSYFGFLLPKQKIQTQGVPKSFYEFKIKTLEGKDFSFSSLRGKKVLIVNTASECGYTPQYEDLERLYKAYGGEKFTIIGFPANNFGAQEPGSNEEIKNFCTQKYHVTFTMSEKISVKGENMDPIYKWLCSKALNSVSDAEVKWNFNKFLIDENGNWVSWLGSKTKPMDESIVQWIEKGNKPEMK